MAGQIVPVALIVVVLLALVVALVLRRARAPRTVVGINQHPEVVRVHRHTRGLRLLGVLAGLTAAALLLTDAAPAWLGGLGLSAALAPAIAGVVLVLATAIGELTAPRTAGIVRTATLEPRRVRDVTPRAGTTLAVGGTLVLAALLTLGAALGSADDLGRAGRTLATACRDASGVVVATSSQGPWPGSFYAVPMGVGLAAVVATALMALAVIARRARPSAEGAALDSRLRQGAARHVLLSVSVATWATAAPLALLMASALRGVEACPPAWFPVGAIVMLFLGLGGLVLATAATVALLSDARLVVDDVPPATPGDPDPIGARR